MYGPYYDCGVFQVRFSITNYLKKILLVMFSVFIAFRTALAKTFSCSICATVLESRAVTFHFSGTTTSKCSLIKVLSRSKSKASL